MLKVKCDNNSYVGILFFSNVTFCLFVFFFRGATRPRGNQQNSGHEGGRRGQGAGGVLHDAAVRAGEGLLRQEAHRAGQRISGRRDAPHLRQPLQVSRVLESAPHSSLVRVSGART